MIKEVRTDGNDLIIESDNRGSKRVSFKRKVDKFFMIEGSVVVMTGHVPEDGAKNIHRYAEDGKKIWTVEEPEGVKGEANAFTGLWLDEQGKLMGGTWQGTDHEIDFDTGRILSNKFTK